MIDEFGIVSIADLGFGKGIFFDCGSEIGYRSEKGKR
jgi:hypothetical protein